MPQDIYIPEFDPERDPCNDPEFIAIVRRLAGNLLIEHRPREFFLIQVKNWFDSKWLRYSGAGIVPFDGFPGGLVTCALEAFWLDDLTFPPFNPRRILAEWKLRDSALVPVDRKDRIHPRRIERSAANLKRTVASRSDSAIFLWFSSNSAPNGRGSAMVYQVLKQEPLAWYASFFRKALWQLDVAKGIDRKKVEALSLIEH